MGGGAGGAGWRRSRLRIVLLSLTDNEIIDEAEAKAILRTRPLPIATRPSLTDGAAQDTRRPRRSSRRSATAATRCGTHRVTRDELPPSPRGRSNHERHGCPLDAQEQIGRHPGFSVERHLVGAVCRFQQQRQAVTVNQEAGSRRTRRVKAGIAGFRQGSRGLRACQAGSKWGDPGQKRPPVPRPTAGRFCAPPVPKPAFMHASPPEPASIPIILHPTRDDLLLAADFIFVIYLAST